MRLRRAVGSELSFLTDINGGWIGSMAMYKIKIAKSTVNRIISVEPELKMGNLYGCVCLYIS